MSLSKLPPQLLAQVSSYLEFKDINKLLQVNKKIKGNLKYYKLDKPNIFLLRFRPNFESEELKIAMKVTEDEKKPKTIKVINIEGDEENIPPLYDTIEKFASIDELVCIKVNLTEELAEKLSTTGTNIKKLHLYNATIGTSTDMFLKLCDRFDLITLEDVEYSILQTEQFLIQVVKKCNFDIIETDLFESILLRNTGISNDFLKCFEGDDAPTTFRMENWVTNITVEGLKKLLKVVVDKNPQSLNWNFGILRLGQIEPARAFLVDIDNGLYPNYKQERRRTAPVARCCISRTDGLGSFNFGFSVRDDDDEENEDEQSSGSNSGFELRIGEL